MRPSPSWPEVSMDSQRSTRNRRVVLFCGNQGLRLRVEAAIRAESDLTWAGCVDSVDAVIRLCRTDCPDTLLIDSRCDPEWKLCLLVTGLFARLTVVALLDDDVRNQMDSAWALLHGASGIIGVDAEPGRLGVALRAATRFGHYVDPSLEVSVNSNAQGGGLRGKPLSAREVEVLQLIADGRTAEQIGHRLGIAADTVRTHIYRILRKLDARDRAHAVALSFQASLLTAAGQKKPGTTPPERSE